MSSSVANTIFFDQVYLKSTGNFAGPVEARGPLGSLFDGTINDLYGHEKSFEKAERMLAKKAIAKCLEKAGSDISQIDLLVGGDLLNQITTANFVARDMGRPFAGVYGACSTSALSLLNGAMFIEGGMRQVLTFTSSHQATAERQYRYPLEYGIQKKLTTTYTATGAAAFLLQKEKTALRIAKATVGKVIDYGLTDANDMGSAMAPAAYQVIKDHFFNTHTKSSDYDLIVTGDLSKFGKKMLEKLMEEENIDTTNFNDCGLMLYDTEKQNVFMGGSGCACSALVLSSLLYQRLISHQYKKILYVPTGALLSPTSINQKETIPCIAHAIEMEVII